MSAIEIFALLIAGHALADYPLQGDFPADLMPDWIIVGGESGRHARPMHQDWARSLRDQCAAVGVPFLFKQWGEWGSADPAPSGTPGKYAIASAALGSTLFPQSVFPVDSYPRQFDLFGGASVMERIGKKAAGRLLDGVEHNGMPEVQHER